MTLPFQLSQILPTLADCENHTGIEVTSHGSPKVQVKFEKLLEIDMPVLGLAGCREWNRNIGAGTQIGGKGTLVQVKWVSLLVAVPNDLPLPPAYEIITVD